MTAAPLVKFRRPTAHLVTVVTLLGLKGVDDVIALVEGGKLRWAWNIATPNARRREWRILSRSVNDYLIHAPAPDISDEDEFQQVVAELFPDADATVPATAVAHTLNGSQDHIACLVRSRELIPIRGQVRPRTGKNASPLIQFSSVVGFLRKRRVS